MFIDVLQVFVLFLSVYKSRIFDKPAGDFGLTMPAVSVETVPL